MSGIMDMSIGEGVRPPKEGCACCSAVGMALGEAVKRRQESVREMMVKEWEKKWQVAYLAYMELKRGKSYGELERDWLIEKMDWGDLEAEYGFAEDELKMENAEEERQAREQERVAEAKRKREADESERRSQAAKKAAETRKRKKLEEALEMSPAKWEIKVEE